MATVLTIDAARLDELETAARRIISIVSAVRKASRRPKADSLIVYGSTFGERVARARKARGMLQRELAVRAAMSAAQLCQIERGCVTPSIAMAKRLADAMGVPVAELMN